MVEATGVEPVSERALRKLSPGAVCQFSFPHPNGGRQPFGFGSFILHSTGKAYHACVHHKNDARSEAVVLFGRTAAYLGSECVIFVI